MDSKVIAYFKFNEASYDGTPDEIVDECGLYHGRVQNGKNISVDGTFGSAISGALGNPVVKIPNREELGMGFILKPSGEDFDNQWHCIFQKPNDFYIEIYRNKLIWRNYNGATIYSKKKAITDDKTHFIYMQDFQGNMELYVDGKLQGKVKSNTYSTNSDYGYLGRFDGDDEALNGSIDELFIVDEIATKDEILSVYNNGVFRELDLQLINNDGLDHDFVSIDKFEELESIVDVVDSLLGQLMTQFSQMGQQLTINAKQIEEIKLQLQNNLSSFSIQELFIELGARLGGYTNNKVTTRTIEVASSNGLLHVNLDGNNAEYDIYPNVIDSTRADVKIENEELSGFDIVIYDSEAFSEDKVRLDCSQSGVTVNFMIVYK